LVIKHLKEIHLGTANTAIGAEALFNNTGTGSTSPPDGTANTAIGNRALYSNITGSTNTAIGINALFSNNADFNIAIGDFSLFDNVSVADNIAMGHYALNNNIADENIAIGNRSGEFISSGASNTLLGYYAGRNITTGSNNTLLGNSSNTVGVGSNNTIVGGNSGASFPGVSNVTIIGANTFNSGTIGDRVVIGSGAGIKIDVGGNNINMGTHYIFGSENIIIGKLISIAGPGSSDDIIIGNNVSIGDGDGNVIIGNSVTDASTFNNNIIIADGVGNRRINVDATGNVGINTSNPTNQLHITGGIDPIRFEGLQTRGSTDSVLVTDGNGVVKRTSLNTIARVYGSYTFTNTEGGTVISHGLFCTFTTPTYTLPAANTTTGRKFVIKLENNPATSAIVLTLSGNIDGAASYDILADGKSSVILQSDGNNYWIIGSH
jgi:hypothetical protein